MGMLLACKEYCKIYEILLCNIIRYFVITHFYTLKTKQASFRAMRCPEYLWPPAWSKSRGVHGTGGRHRGDTHMEVEKQALVEFRPAE